MALDCGMHTSVLHVPEATFDGVDSEDKFCNGDPLTSLHVQVAAFTLAPVMHWMYL